MKNKISLKDAMSIGIGGMVGGGIFAVLGLAVSISKGATYISFLIAGILALITSYAYSKLSMKFPDKGGTVRFINEGFGISIFSGAINNLLWVSYIIMLALYASAFGSYAPNLYALTSNSALDSHVYATGIIILATVINYYSISVVGKIESYAVVVKLIILICFIGIGAYGLIGNPNIAQLGISNWSGSSKILAGGMVIFVAYEGFELIANAAPDIENPKINIPKAYKYSVVFVVFLYVVIAAVTVGSLPFSEIATAEDYVLAEAAKPMLGNTGFTIITVAALISTFSAINASLYGGSRVSYEIAEDDELPNCLTYKLWNQPIGLLITAFLTIIITNIMELESISTAGSIGFLLIFGVVNYVAYKLSDNIGGNKFISILGFFMCIVALLVLILQQLESNILSVMIAFFIVFACFIGEFIFKRFFDKKSI